MGYAQSGFEVFGCDIEERPRYPFSYHIGDALEYLKLLIDTGDISQYSLINASPPCQAKCALTVGTNQSQGWGNDHIDLVTHTRILLNEVDIPYVLEQPTGKSEIRKDITLCGEMFGLGVIRHRHFELGGWSTDKPQHKEHRGRVRGWRHGVYYDGPYVAAYGSGGGKASIEEMQNAMGIDWTDVREELTEAIPPSYTRWIGEKFLGRMTHEF